MNQYLNVLGRTPQGREGGADVVLKVNVELDREVDSNAFKIVLEMTRTSRADRMESWALVSVRNSVMGCSENIPFVLAKCFDLCRPYTAIFDGLLCITYTTLRSRIISRYFFNDRNFTAYPRYASPSIRANFTDV